MPYIGNVLTSFAVETGNIADQAVTAPKLSATGGTNGQVLGLDAGGNLVWTSDPAGQWVTSGSNIYFDTGNVGIGTTTPTSLLSVDGVGAFGLGSASAPSVSFNGDLNTGLYSPGADQVAISTNGTRRLQVNSDGTLNVFGVNKTASGGGNSIIYATDTQAVDVGGSIGFGGYYIGTSSDTEWAQIAGRKENSTSGNYAGYLQFSTRVNGGSTSEKMRLTSDGKLGLGTSSPGSFQAGANNLVVGTGSGDNGISIFAGAANEGRLYFARTGELIRGQVKYDFSADKMYFGVDSATRATLTSTGLGVGTTSPAYALDCSSSTETAIRINSGAGYNAVLRFSQAGTNKAFINYQNGGGLTFGPAGSETLRIDSSGRVGIGTTSPQGVLEATNAASPVSRIIVGGDGGGGASTAFTQVAGGGDVRFTTAGTERARIDSSGRLLVGTSTGSYSLEIADNNEANFAVRTYNDGSSNFAGIRLFKSRGTQASPTIVSSGDTLSNIVSYGYDGTTWQQASFIRTQVDGTPGSGSMPGRLVFYTTSTGAGSSTERMRITNDGLFKFSNTGAYGSIDAGAHGFRQGNSGNWVLEAVHSGTSGNVYGIHSQFPDYAPNNTSSWLYLGSDSSVNRFLVYSNGGIANYQSNNVNLCDQREKKNIEALDSTWGCLKNWELKKFHYNEDADTDDKRYGVIAQQVAKHCPEVISDWVKQKAEDAVLDDDGNVVTPAKEEITRMAVKEQQMMWMAIKALQEAQVRIETLEAEVAALKAQ